MYVCGFACAFVRVRVSVVILCPFVYTCVLLFSLCFVLLCVCVFLLVVVFKLWVEGRMESSCSCSFSSC